MRIQIALKLAFAVGLNVLLVVVGVDLLTGGPAPRYFPTALDASPPALAP